MGHHRHRDDHRTLDQILKEEREILRDDREILHDLHHTITGFTPIKETHMVPLAAGQTAVFSTTAVPTTATPSASGILWTSSDTENAPVSPNTADPSGLSTQVVFPDSVLAGVTFALTVKYTNADGTIASQTDTFVTVAPPPSDITGFTAITQTA